MEQIAAGLYVETSYTGGNVGLIVTQAGVIAVDVPMLPLELRDWRGQIAKITDLPTIAVIQTDFDQPRAIGPSLLDVPVISHDINWDKMRAYSNEKVLGQINDMLADVGGKQVWEPRLPEVTFSERLMLYKGGREIHVLHAGGHSPGSCLVYLPEESVIFAGDAVFCNEHPSMAQAETKEWLETLSYMRKLSVDLIVPGHGRPCDRDATYPLSEYIRDMRAMVRRSYQAGQTKSETSSSLVPQFMGAFPYEESDRDRVRQLVKGASDRIYDEYRAVAKADAVRARGGAVKNKARRKKRRSS